VRVASRHSLQHSMLYFLNHYEVPYILHEYRIQRLLETGVTIHQQQANESAPRAPPAASRTAFASHGVSQIMRFEFQTIFPHSFLQALLLCRQQPPPKPWQQTLCVIYFVRRCYDRPCTRISTRSRSYTIIQRRHDHVFPT
jgi:hypothetical protein